MTVHPLRVTSRLQSPASAPVQLGAPEFTAVQFAAAREVAFSRAFPRTGAHCNALPRHGNFPFAKVGVEGSNPFARSNFPNQRSVRRPRFLRVLGCVLLPKPEVPRRPRKARGYLRVTGSDDFRRTRAAASSSRCGRWHRVSWDDVMARWEVEIGSRWTLKSPL